MSVQKLYLLKIATHKDNAQFLVFQCDVMQKKYYVSRLLKIYLVPFWGAPIPLLGTTRLNQNGYEQVKISEVLLTH